jgi:hypothetical protein
MIARFAGEGKVGCHLRWHSHFPPFAKDAKDGAPFVLPMPGNIKKLGHPTRKSF